MKFIGAMVFIGLGYAFTYYGISMWRRYSSTSQHSGEGIPLGYLLFGLNGVGPVKSGAAMPQSQPPFQNAVPTAAMPATQSNPSTPTAPKVQSV